MEPLAWAEELDRHGDVVRRHPVYRLPACVGRGYDADVILDDRHVAARHLELRRGADGTLEAVDLGSLNGTQRFAGGEPIAATPVHGDEVLRLGQTQLRIRLPGHPVPPELPLRAQGWDRHPGVLAAAIVAFSAICALQVYAMLTETDRSQLYSLPLLLALAVTVWAAVWSLICRTVTGHANFVAHGIVAFAGAIASLLLDAAAGYVEFAFDFDRLGGLWLGLAATVFAAMLYRHLRLTVRLGRPALATMAVVLSTALFGSLEGFAAIRNANKHGLQDYAATVKPAAFLFARGVTPARFVESADRLKAAVDRELRAAEP